LKRLQFRLKFGTGFKVKLLIHGPVVYNGQRNGTSEIVVVLENFSFGLPNSHALASSVYKSIVKDYL
jgi:hypothetical protein